MTTTYAVPELIEETRTAGETLSNAITYLQFSRDPKDFPFFTCQPLEQAIRVLYASLARVQMGGR